MLREREKENRFHIVYPEQSNVSASMFSCRFIIYPKHIEQAEQNNSKTDKYEYGAMRIRPLSISFCLMSLTPQYLCTTLRFKHLLKWKSGPNAWRENMRAHIGEIKYGGSTLRIQM